MSASTDLFCGMLFLMAAGHVLCDFQLQPSHLSEAKRPGGHPALPWQFALGAHSLLHGAAVALITGLWWVGALETIAHVSIDFGKCRKWYGMTADQAAHLLCKIAWAVVALEALS